MIIRKQRHHFENNDSLTIQREKEIEKGNDSLSTKGKNQVLLKGVIKASFLRHQEEHMKRSEFKTCTFL